MWHAVPTGIGAVSRWWAPTWLRSTSQPARSQSTRPRGNQHGLGRELLRMPFLSTSLHSCLSWPPHPHVRSVGAFHGVLCPSRGTSLCERCMHAHAHFLAVAKARKLQRFCACRSNLLHAVSSKSSSAMRHRSGERERERNGRGSIGHMVRPPACRAVSV